MSATVLPFSLKSTAAEANAKEIARWLMGAAPKPDCIDDAEGTYFWMLKRRASTGILPSGVEQMIWHYAWGKPTEVIEARIKRDELTEMSDIQLADYIEMLIVRLRKLQGAA